MSNDTTRVRMPSALRAVLIGAGLATIWLCAGAALDSPTASAAEVMPSQQSSPNGLLGVVDEVVGGVEEITSATGQLLQSDLASTIVEPVAGATDTIVVETVGAVPLVGDDLTAVTGASATGAVLTPVSTVIDAVLGVTGEVTGDAGGVVGDLLDVPRLPQLDLTPDVSVGPVLQPLVAASAATAVAVEPAVIEPGLRSTQRGDDAVAAPVIANSSIGSVAPATPAAPGTPPASPSGAVAGSTIFFALVGDFGDALSTAALRGGALSALDDSTLPTSATYDTDSSPD